MAQVRRQNIRRRVRKGTAGFKVKTTPKVASAARAALAAGVPEKKVKRQVKKALRTTVTTSVKTGRKKPGEGLRRSEAVEAASARNRRRLRAKRSVR